MKKVYIKMPVKVHSANKSATEDVAHNIDFIHHNGTYHRRFNECYMQFHNDVALVFALLSPLSPTHKNTQYSISN